MSRFDFIKDHVLRMGLEDAYDSVDEMNLWNYLGSNIFNSFAYYEGPEMATHLELLKKADKRNIHSSVSFDVTMRNIEQIAKNGFHQWKSDYMRNFGE